MRDQRICAPDLIAEHSDWGHANFSPIPDVNLIRFDKIYSGEETRTSCILRNLPNRMTQLELMEVGPLAHLRAAWSRIVPARRC